MMTIQRVLRAVGAQENLNFLLTNRIPRIALTRFMAGSANCGTPG